jgi:hypothetical protein
VQPGADVMITKFSAKKLAFFPKTKIMIKFWQKLADTWAKNANFIANFLATIFLKR